MSSSIAVLAVLSHGPESNFKNILLDQLTKGNCLKGIWFVIYAMIAYKFLSNKLFSSDCPSHCWMAYFHNDLSSVKILISSH